MLLVHITVSLTGTFNDPSRPSGQGCYASAGGCYLQGNDDLKAETSINKEIGLEFKRDGWLAGVTWFRNDYRNKIEAGYVAVGKNAVGTDLYQWDNVPKAVVEL